MVWIPAWSVMEESEWGPSEYRPPLYLTADRIPLFTAAAWEQFRTMNKEIPAVGELLALDSREAARWYQWSAPGALLGEFPTTPLMNREAVLASSEGELDVEAVAIDHFLLDLHDRPVPMKPVSLQDLSLIELWIDLPGTPAWSGLGRIGGSLCLVLGESLALVRDDD